MNRDTESIVFQKGRTVLRTVLNINNNVHQVHIFSSEGCEALNAKVSRRNYNVHGKRRFHIRTHNSAERVQAFCCQ
jgi:hypothetical protein